MSLQSQYEHLSSRIRVGQAALQQHGTFRDTFANLPVLNPAHQAAYMECVEEEGYLLDELSELQKKLDSLCADEVLKDNGYTLSFTFRPEGAFSAIFTGPYEEHDVFITATGHDKRHCVEKLRKTPNLGQPADTALRRLMMQLPIG